MHEEAAGRAVSWADYSWDLRRLSTWLLLPLLGFSVESGAMLDPYNSPYIIPLYIYIYTYYGSSFPYPQARVASAVGTFSCFLG